MSTSGDGGSQPGSESESESLTAELDPEIGLLGALAIDIGTRLQQSIEKLRTRLAGRVDPLEEIEDR